MLLQVGEHFRWPIWYCNLATCNLLTLKLPLLKVSLTWPTLDMCSKQKAMLGYSSLKIKLFWVLHMCLSTSELMDTKGKWDMVYELSKDHLNARNYFTFDKLLVLDCLSVCWWWWIVNMRIWKKLRLALRLWDIHNCCSNETVRPVKFDTNFVRPMVICFL